MESCSAGKNIALLINKVDTLLQVVIFELGEDSNKIVNLVGDKFESLIPVEAANSVNPAGAERAGAIVNDFTFLQHYMIAIANGELQVSN